MKTEVRCGSGYLDQKLKSYWDQEFTKKKEEKILNWIWDHKSTLELKNYVNILVILVLG